MASKFLTPALAGTLLLAGCNLPLGSLRAPDTGGVANGSAVLQLQPEVQSGGFRAQATVSPYTSTNVSFFEFSLFKLDAQGNEASVKNAQGNPMVVTAPRAVLGGSVTFEKLNANSTYRIKAKAYADPLGTQLISTADTQSQTDIRIDQEDRPTLAKIKVQLIDKPFDGQGSTTVDVSSGSFVPAGSESITVVDPGPV
ncbi:hypothetical protein D3C87_950450 [compost metagenome]